MTSPSDQGADHLTDTQIAAYLDQGLDSSQRADVERHLAECSECRQQMTGSRIVLDRVRRPRKLAISAGLVAAAALAFLLVRPSVDSLNRRSVLRATGDGGGLVAYGPIGLAAMTGTAFSWGSATGAESYRLTVTGDDGSPVWTSSGTDTSVVIPDSVVLTRNKRYIWVVDALLSDGRTRSTGLHEFRVDR